MTTNYFMPTTDTTPLPAEGAIWKLIFSLCFLLTNSCEADVELCTRNINGNMICEINGDIIDCSGETNTVNQVIGLEDGWRKDNEETCRKYAKNTDPCWKAFIPQHFEIEISDKSAQLKCECLSRRITRKGFICSAHGINWQWMYDLQ